MAELFFLSCRGSHSIESVSVLCQWGIGGVCSYCWIISIWSSTNHISFTGWTEGIEFNYMHEVISFCVQTEFLSAYNMTVLRPFCDLWSHAMHKTLLHCIIFHTLLHVQSVVLLANFYINLVHFLWIFFNIYIYTHIPKKRKEKRGKKRFELVTSASWGMDLANCTSPWGCAFFMALPLIKVLLRLYSE